MQLGCTGNPLLLDYSVWGHLATKSWITSFWEALDSYPGNLWIHFADIPLQCEHDQTLMGVAHSYGLQGHELLSFNQCCCAKKLFFLSDSKRQQIRTMGSARATCSHIKAQFPSRTTHCTGLTGMVSGLEGSPIQLCVSG